MIRVVLPSPLRRLAGIDGEVQLAVAGAVTLQAVLDALESRYPVLRGAIRDAHSGGRRPFLRYFAGGEDWSLAAPAAPLPAPVADGREPLRIVAAIAGG